VQDFNSDIELDNDFYEITSGPWHYDPAEQAWTAQTGPHTWAVVPGDPDDPPRFDPQEGS
jgi:hypothetical protein